VCHRVSTVAGPVAVVRPNPWYPTFNPAGLPVHQGGGLQRTRLLCRPAGYLKWHGSQSGFPGSAGGRSPSGVPRRGSSLTGKILIVAQIPAFPSVTGFVMQLACCMLGLHTPCRALNSCSHTVDCQQPIVAAFATSVNPCGSRCTCGMWRTLWLTKLY